MTDPRHQRAATAARSGEEIKESCRRAVARRQDAIVGLSHRIHAHPETAFQEIRAARWTAELLADAGFAVEEGICDLPTAFRASYGTGSLHLAICAEYDALPGIGHACGHNIIAAAAVAAAVAVAPVADDLGIHLSVLGTPAEEGGGGKILLLERGAFAGVHAAMMVHPFPVELVAPACLAVSHFAARYAGTAAHAAADPEHGVNALGALTVAQVAIGLLREHLPATARVHGIVTDGGAAANVVPATSCAEYFVRAPTRAELRSVEERVRHCFEAGALASGAGLAIEELSPVYSELRTDDDLASLWHRNAVDLGRSFATGAPLPISTDMANVSLEIPVIHPMIDIGSLPAVNHQPEFAAAAITPRADEALLSAAVAMAWTCVDAATTPTTRCRLEAPPPDHAHG